MMPSNAQTLATTAKAAHERARKAQEEARKVAAKVQAETGYGRSGSEPTIATVAAAQGGV